jgi:DNA (cytosine-5)-methyltransferase 1
MRLSLVGRIERAGRAGGVLMRDKPAYCIPSMSEIAASPLNGLRVASLFSGCGGSSLGYRMAGFKVVWANEFIPAARDTYVANFPTTPIDPRDIRAINADDIVAATGIAIGELDILDGSPPCSSFSVAGRRQLDWGKVKTYSETRQRTDDLFFQFVRLLTALQPRAFVAENVAGLIRGVGKGFFLDILAALKGTGYRVEVRLLDAQWLGVPQVRQRLFFVGVRPDLEAPPAFPSPLPYRYTLRDATDATTATIEPETDMRRFEVGKELDKLGQGGRSARYFQLARASLAEPAPTIIAKGGDPSIATVAHPTECRKFSIAELRAICGFPADFVLTGTYRQQWERLGRAVPPPMMAAIASAIRDRVLTHEKGATCVAPSPRAAA